LLIPVLGLVEAGGWSNLKARIATNASAEYTHLGAPWARSATTLWGIHWTGIDFGLWNGDFVRYWTTDFLVVQRVLSAKDSCVRRRWRRSLAPPSKCSCPHCHSPPGLLAIAVLTVKLTGEGTAIATGGHSTMKCSPWCWRDTAARDCWDWVLPADGGFIPDGGQRQRLSTVWTTTIRRILNKKADDAQYVRMALEHARRRVHQHRHRLFVMHFLSIMDYVQALFSFSSAPVGTVILGMLWKGATPAGGFGACWLGTASSIGMWAWVKLSPGAIAYVALSSHASDMAQNSVPALWSWIVCVAVTVLVSVSRRQDPRSN